MTLAPRKVHRPPTPACPLSLFWSIARYSKGWFAAWPDVSVATSCDCVSAPPADEGAALSWTDCLTGAPKDALGTTAARFFLKAVSASLGIAEIAFTPLAFAGAAFGDVAAAPGVGRTDSSP
jgi:hypothetical protein